MAEFFSNALVDSGLIRYPSTQTFTYINGGVSSALDFWLVTPHIRVDEIRSGGSTIAQHRPLTATFSMDFPEGTSCFSFLRLFASVFKPSIFGEGTVLQQLLFVFVTH